MKRKIGMALLMCLIILLFSGCGGESVPLSALDRPIQVGIVQFGENARHDAAREAFVSQLEMLGYGADRVEVDFLPAGTDEERLLQIAGQFAEDKKDLIVAVSTKAAQAAVQASAGEIPVLFLCVENPVTAGLLRNKYTPSEVVTGVTSAVPADRIFNFMVQDFAGTPFNNIGLLYNTSSPDAIQTINDIKDYLNNNAITFQDAVVADALEAQQALVSMLYDPAQMASANAEDTTNQAVKAIYLSDDPVIRESLPQIEEMLVDENVVVYVGAEDMLFEGNCTAVVADSEAIGTQGAYMAEKIFNGVPLSMIPCEDAGVYGKVTPAPAEADAQEQGV